MRISLFGNQHDPIPRHVNVKFDELPSLLEAQPHEPLSMWSPFTFKEPRRKKSFADTTEMFVADFDDASELDLLAHEDFLQARGIAYIIHTTRSHTPEKPRKRIIVLLSRPVSGQKWTQAWLQMAALFKRHDPACKDPSRAFFVPGKGTCDYHPGEGWNWEEETLGRRALETAARKLHGGDQVQVQLVLDGRPWATRGERDTELLKLVTNINRHASQAPVEAIAEAFRASVRSLKDLDFTMELVLDKVERSREFVRQEELENQKKQEKQKQERVQAYLTSAGRDTLYSEEEKLQLAEKFHYPTMSHRWIVQYRDSYYTLTSSGNYVIRSNSDAKSAFPADLAPAGLDLWNTSKQGKDTLKPLHEIVAEYGVVADGVTVDLTERQSFFREMDRTFVEAPLAAPPVGPVYHADVDEWLEAMTDEPAKLKAWLQFFTWLERPCVALALIGAKNTGKSLLAAGLARIYNQDSPTDLKTILNSKGEIDWTQSLMTCPFLFSDEKLPKLGFTNNANTEMLRELVQLRTQVLKRKFLPDAKMRGATRLMVAANNDKIFANSGDNTPEDFAATAERFLMLTAMPEASRVLAKHSPEELENEWKGYKIAEHTLWLRDNNGAEPEGRFLIKTDTDAQARFISLQHGNSQSVRELLGRVLADPQLASGSLAYTKVDQVNESWSVSVRFVEEVWEQYMDKATRKPSGADITKALKALGEQGERLAVRGTSLRPYTYKVPREMLEIALENSGQGCADEVGSALENVAQARGGK